MHHIGGTMSPMASKTIRGEAEMTTVAEELLSILPQKKSANTLALSGELGAGKTALVRALARQLGVSEHITSPTFVIMKTYTPSQHASFETLVHIDAYRVEDPAEMEVLGLSELFQKERTLICIEWPEHIQELIPKDALSVRIEVTGEAERNVTYGN